MPTPASFRPALAASVPTGHLVHCPAGTPGAAVSSGGGAWAEQGGAYLLAFTQWAGDRNPQKPQPHTTTETYLLPQNKGRRQEKKPELSRI